jgi:hypothetical protein
MVWDPIVQYITMLFNYIGFMIMGNNRYIIQNLPRLLRSTALGGMNIIYYWFYWKESRRLHLLPSLGQDIPSPSSTFDLLLLNALQCTMQGLGL